jgi:DNA-binding transcriptional MocR family regulator
VTSSSLTLTELIARGAGEIAHYRGRARPPVSPLEWLGIAVAHLPELTAAAHTGDALAHARPASAGVRGQLMASLARELGAAAATVEEARRQLAERYPDCDDGETPEDYSNLVELAQRSAPRRSEMMVGAYASFLGGAIEAAGALADTELDRLGARRWDRADHERATDLRAEQLHAALTNALGGLLAYARLLDESAAAPR